MARPVLVVTALDDPTSDLVITELHSRAVPVVRLDPGDFPDGVRLDAETTTAGMTGRLHTRSRSLALDDVRAVYWRRPSPYPTPEGLTSQDAQWTVNQSRWGLGGVLAALPGALYVNHPWRNRDAESKPAQLAVAVNCGFPVPPTLVTNQPDRARAFGERHGPMVYKPLWRGDHRADDGTGRTIWTRVVDLEELDARVAGTAHLFQARVAKTADIRSTAVGGTVFSVRIDGSTTLDWRESYRELTYTPVPTPAGVAESIRDYLRSFGLCHGAFDFAVAPDGTWTFLECNPNGQWAWITETSADIAAALADLLQRGRT